MIPSSIIPNIPPNGAVACRIELNAAILNNSQFPPAAGMRIYQLDAASRDASTNETIIRNQQAYMLTKWLEAGVFEAVERRWVGGWAGGWLNGVMHLSDMRRHRA